MERYRSGHNGDASKAFCVKAHVGSNPTRSAQAKKQTIHRLLFSFSTFKNRRILSALYRDKNPKNIMRLSFRRFSPEKSTLTQSLSVVFFIGKTLENARFYRIITHEFPHTLRIKGDASSLTKPLSSDIFATGHRDRGKGESRVHMA